ncbi:DUF669 domain-containing protein [Clostridium sardiniense]|uniref:DUF669 domain-containing protein n=1 Tax=Clostridium sardiniense TaxID=29369 RepID=UPI001A9C36EF|nr:DUF669 domain-containing protein [Clostridium sardiniense]MBM7836423.1 hypothetical protein [Clostridium sardiniense]
MELWEKFDKNIDTEGLKKDTEEAKENAGNFKEVPHGEYEVEISKIELKATKKGDPMLSIWFKILTGEYKDSLIFYNQVLNNGYGIHNANEFLRSLETEVDVDFDNFTQYNELLLDVFEAVNGNLEFALKYSQNAKNEKYSDYEITEVFEKED